MTAAALWRRLDVPGHDSARLETSSEGHRLIGTAVFLSPDGPANLAYELDLAPDWRTRSGRVRGFIGSRTVGRSIRRTDTGWLLDDAAVPGLEHCVDLDIGFTPATNAPQLKRLGLPVGGRAAFDVAWLDGEALTISALPQVYARCSENLYDYASPQHGYAEPLDIAADGFVRDYPGLWRREG